MVTCKCGVKLEESSGICPNCGEEIEISIKEVEKEGGQLFEAPTGYSRDHCEEVTPEDRRRNQRRARERLASPVRPKRG